MGDAIVAVAATMGALIAIVGIATLHPRVRAKLPPGSRGAKTSVGMIVVGALLTMLALGFFSD